jgi:adenylate kinase
MVRRGPRILLLGAPGVGKGTYGGFIAPRFNIPILAMGDMVRAEIASNSTIGAKFAEYSNLGKLVPDELVCDLAISRIKPLSLGFMLDGFPRTLPQTLALEKAAIELDLVLEFLLPKEILVSKAVNRRLCASCGKGFNLADINQDGIVMPPLLPKIEGICDKCQGKLIQREDDKEQVVRKRLEVYDAQTLPISAHFAERGILKQFNIKRGIDDVPEILALIEHVLADKSLL